MNVINFKWSTSFLPAIVRHIIYRTGCHSVSNPLDLWQLKCRLGSQNYHRLAPQIYPSHTQNHHLHILTSCESFYRFFHAFQDVQVRCIFCSFSMSIVFFRSCRLWERPRLNYRCFYHRPSWFCMLGIKGHYLWLYSD